LLFATVDRIFLPKPVARYISRLVAATHPGSPEAPDKVRQYVAFGASPRAAIAIAEAARSLALLAGRPTVGFDDVKAVAGPALNHRLILNYQARFAKVDSFQVAAELTARLDETGLTLPAGVAVAHAAG
jgi:MoxR-like ATPase